MKNSKYDRFVSRKSPARELLCGGILLRAGGRLKDALLVLFFLILIANLYVQNCVESSRKEQERLKEQGECDKEKID